MCKNCVINTTQKCFRRSKKPIFVLSQMICPIWNVPFTLSWSSLLLPMVGWTAVSSLLEAYTWIFSSQTILDDVLGCKVEMFYLNVEAVNTHRDRPLVSPHLSQWCSLLQYEILMEDIKYLFYNHWCHIYLLDLDVSSVMFLKLHNKHAMFLTVQLLISWWLCFDWESQFNLCMSAVCDACCLSWRTLAKAIFWVNTT